MNVPDRRASRDLVVISVVALGALLAAIYFDLFEAFVEFSENHEEWQLDEFIFVPVVFGVAFGSYAARRWREMRREIARREQEERLRRFNEQSARILESITDAFVALDEDCPRRGLALYLRQLPGRAAARPGEGRTARAQYLGGVPRSCRHGLLRGVSPGGRRADDGCLRGVLPAAR